MRPKESPIHANSRTNLFRTVCKSIFNNWHIVKSFLSGRWRHVGQNLFIYMSTANGKGADWPSAIKAWYDEYKYYKYPNNPNSQTGHYTQVGE